MNAPTPRLATPFALALRERITKKITALKKDGTVAMGADNLLALTLPKGSDENLPGAIRGTNAPYYYKELFLEVLASLPAARKFILN